MKLKTGKKKLVYFIFLKLLARANVVLVLGLADMAQ